MATTSLWHIKGRLKDLIDYVENPEKILPSRDMQDFFDVFSYVKNPQKTDNGKSKKRIPTAKEMRTFIENTHTPLINRELWDKVQIIRENERRPTKNGATSIFTGLLGGTKLSLRAAKNYLYFRCSKYKGNSRSGICTQHYI